MGLRLSGEDIPYMSVKLSLCSYEGSVRMFSKLGIVGLGIAVGVPVWGVALAVGGVVAVSAGVGYAVGAASGAAVAAAGAAAL